MTEWLTLLNTTLLKMESAVTTIAPEVWRIYVKQAIINAWANFIWVFVSLIGIFASIKLIQKDPTQYDDGYRTWGIILLVFSLFILALSVEGAIGLFNPEYGALKLLQYTLLP